MKLAITITDASAADLLRIASLLNGNDLPTMAGLPTPTASAQPSIPTPTATAQPQTTAPAGDDDESGPVNASAPATDSEGLPWDERIHSKNKATNADGSWRKRRGVSDDTVKTVEAELRARQVPAMPSGQAPQTPTVPPMPQPPAPEAAAPQMPTQPVPMPVMPMPAGQPPQIPTMPGTMDAAAAAGQPAPTPQPEQPSAPAQPAAPTGNMDFQTFMISLQQQMQKRDGNGNPLIDANYLAQIVPQISQAFNTPLNVITDLSAHPHMIGYAVQLMQSHGRWQ